MNLPIQRKALIGFALSFGLSTLFAVPLAFADESRAEAKTHQSTSANPTLAESHLQQGESIELEAINHDGMDHGSMEHDMMGADVNADASKAEAKHDH